MKYALIERKDTGTYDFMKLVDVDVIKCKIIDTVDSQLEMHNAYRNMMMKYPLIRISYDGTSECGKGVYLQTTNKTINKIRGYIDRQVSTNLIRQY